MKLLRILHVIPSLDPAFGGPPKIAARLAAAQAGLGHHVTMAHYHEPQAQALIDRELAAIPHADRVHYQTIRKPAHRPAPDRAAVAELLQTGPAGAPPDFVHFHSLWAPLTKRTADAAFARGIPYTILLNGMLDPWSLAQKKWKKKLALLLGYKRMLDRAAFLHTGNADEVRLIAPLKIRSPHRTIPNGVFLEEISPLPAPGTFYRLFPQLGGEQFVLFLGRLHYKKGLDYLADAFAAVSARVPRVRLVVAGPDDGARDDFVRRVNAAGIAHRVHVIGPIYEQQRLAALAEAALFCLPSRQEGFSLAITEALGCGLPVVISQPCHFPEVADAGAGFVLPLDSNAFADAMVKILTDAELRARMSRAGAELVRTRYTWPAIAEQTIGAYQEFAKAVPSPCVTVQS